MAKTTQLQPMSIHWKDVQRETNITAHVYVWDDSLSSLVHVRPNLTGPQNSRKVDEQRRVGEMSTRANPVKIASARDGMKRSRRPTFCRSQRRNGLLRGSQGGVQPIFLLRQDISLA